MPPSRRRFISTAIALYLVLIAWDVLRKRDDWPISDYHMYSGIETSWFRKKELIGVSPAGEFLLRREMTEPLSEATLRYALDRLGSSADRRRRALDVFKSHYERKRRAHPEWPELVGLRIYEKKWKTRLDLSNLKRPRAKLVAETQYAPGRIEGRAGQDGRD